MSSFQEFIAGALQKLSSAGPIYTWITIWIIVGNFLGLYFIGHYSNTQLIDYGQAIIWGVAIFLLGALIGIIFGVPKTVSSPVAAVVTTVNQAEDANKALSGSTNNLTEISDWLTKVVIGAGLVQLKEMPHFIWRVATKMALGMSTSVTII